MCFSFQSTVSVCTYTSMPQTFVLSDCSPEVPFHDGEYEGTSLPGVFKKTGSNFHLQVRVVSPPCPGQPDCELQKIGVYIADLEDSRSKADHPVDDDQESHGCPMDDDPEDRELRRVALMDPRLKEVPTWLTFDTARENVYIQTFSKWRQRSVHMVCALTFFACTSMILRAVSGQNALDGRPCSISDLTAATGLLSMLVLEVFLFFCLH